MHNTIANQLSFRFRAMASSTARNCLSSSSLRVFLPFADDEFAWLELFDNGADAFTSDSCGERFLAASAAWK